MAGLCVVLMLYIALISLGLVSWGKLADGFDNHELKDITRMACEVSKGFHSCSGGSVQEMSGWVGRWVCGFLPWWVLALVVGS